TLLIAWTSQRVQILRRRPSFVAHCDAMLNGENQLIIRIDYGVGITGSAHPILLDVKVFQHLLMRPIDPRLKVAAGVACSESTCVESIVAACPNRVTPIVRHSATWIIAPDCITL